MATGASGLVVGDIDRKNGKDGFLSLAHAGRSLTPTVHYPTDSDGEHWVYRGDPTLSPSTNLDGMEGVDRRSGGSYIIWWSDLVPATMGDFSSDVPEWLTHVSTKPVAQHTGFEGAINEWLDTLPAGQPSTKVRAFLQAIPVDKFGHEDVVRVTYNLVRLGSEREPGVRQALDMLYKLWVKPPYDTPEHKSELVKAVQGAIRKAGAPEEDVPDLLPVIDVWNALPQFSSTGTEFLTMITEEPTVKSNAVYDNARQVLVREMLAAGLTTQQALTMAWASKVGQKFAPDRLADLWHEVESIANESTPDEPLAPVTPIRTAPPTVQAFNLINDAEQAYLAEQGGWWGTRYLDWVAERVPMMNGPYHRANRWVLLSLIFSEQGHFRTKAQKVNLGMYVMVPGKSTTGKSESFDLTEQVMDAYFGKANSHYVGNLSKMSSNGLHRALIQRDGQSSLLRSDEAQGLLKQIKDSKWQDGLLSDVADYYEGKIRAKQMNTDRDLSGISAHGYVTVHLTGIDTEIMENLELAHWKSGLLLRFVWHIGEPFEMTDSFFEASQYEGDDDEFDQLPKQWAAEFSAVHDENEAIGGEWRSVRHDRDALKRITQMNREMYEALKGHPRYETVLRPAQIRLSMSVRKAATIIALSEASETVTLRHELIAIQQAEEWLSAMVQMLDKTSETTFDREVAEVGALIRSKPGQKMREADVFTAYKPRERAERILQQLVSEDIVARDGRDKSGVAWIQLKARGLAA